MISEKLQFLARPGKDSLDQEERPDFVTFQELGSCTSLHGQAFIHLKSQPKLYYPNKVRTCEQGESVVFSPELYKEKVMIKKND
jgi:hypothetical protein